MKRQTIFLTAQQAATKTYNWVAAKPENTNKTPKQLKKETATLLTRMIQTGLFTITDAS